MGVSALIILLFSSLLNGQADGFTASAPASVRAGAQFQYVIEGSERGEVILPSMNDFQLLAGPFSSFSSQSQWINGKMTMNTVVTYTHVFRANNQGTFTIPPATVKVGRKVYKTNQVEIVVQGGSSPSPAQGAGQPGGSAGQPGGGADQSVIPSVEDQPIFLRVIPSKREVYVGEQFVTGLKIYTRVNTRPASSSKDLPFEGFYKKMLDPDANSQQQNIDGQQYLTQVIQRHILIPQKSGDVVIDPYESEWMIPQRRKQRSNSRFESFFDDPFFDNIQEVPVKLFTPAVTIHVKPLPSGAPEGFTGAVGDFSIHASLSANEIETNEAISLKITLRGAGNLPLLGEPVVNLPPDHDLYDVTKSLNISTSGNRINGSVTFEYPIVARHAGRFRIAPVRFAWFDPGKGEYRSATTEEFTFTVLKGETGESAGSVYIPGVMQESVEDIGTDIRDVIRVPQLFTPLSASLLSTGWYRLLYPLAIGLSILLIVLIRLVARRNADLTLVRNRQASRSARARLKKADRYRKSGEEDRFYEEVGKALWGYVADKLNIETSTLSREVILSELEKRKLPDELRSEFLKILDDSEFSRFAPSSEKSDVNHLYREAAILIKNLENSL